MSLSKQTVPEITSPAQLTRHARMRMQQRGITWEMIKLAARYGRWRRHRNRDRDPRRYRSGCTGKRNRFCLTLTDRTLRGTELEPQADRLRGLCLVLSEEGTIITVKWDYPLREPGLLRRQRCPRE